MRCSSCGGNHSSNHCQQSARASTTAVALSPQELESAQSNVEKLDLGEEMEGFSSEAKPISRLIEFPGVTRRAVPQWRKELSERVREVQERRTREAAAEAEEAQRIENEQPTTSAPQLELLPHAEMPPVNPVVAAALRRIERAYEEPLSSGYSRAATAVAVVADAEMAFTDAVADLEIEVNPLSESPPVAERTRNLVIVQAAAGPDSETSNQKPKPKRLIVDGANDPALSYLDSIVLAGALSATGEDRAPLFMRITAAVIDAITVGFLCLPFAAVVELQDGNWHQPGIVGLMIGIAAAVMFVYATVSTALTGRTFGMRLLSLRAIDVRTGLIPTGKQSAGRALIYLLSLATMGIGLLLAFARGEGKTTHDRVSRTAVVRD